MTAPTTPTGVDFATDAATIDRLAELAIPDGDFVTEIAEFFLIDARSALEGILERHR
jgi:hypothetical protein